MRARMVPLRAVAWGASALLWSGAAGAQQADTNPPVPNVLILLDNSGSMERMIDGTIPESNPANACNCTDNGPGNAPTCAFPDIAHPTAASPIPNRWNTLQQALTGSLAAQSGTPAPRSGFNCVAMARTPNSTFAQEYEIGGPSNALYDQNYYLNFHRMVAEDTQGATGVACVMGPGPLPGAATSGSGVGPPATALFGGPATKATDYVAGATVARPYGILPSSSNSTTCNFTQLQNGSITSLSSVIQFGLMTFDSDTGAGTGVTAANAVNTTPFTGMWSYYPGWNTLAACNFSPYAPVSNCSGNPIDCSTGSMWAVGARNPGAPPWEGRMVPLPTPTGLTQAQSNAEVAQVILASRPYGPTPLAGMLTAAQYYFQGDPTGPQTDPYVKPPSGLPCRKEFIILITDGSPNLDMQPSCSGNAEGGAAGNCPFNLPTTTVQSLYQGGVAMANQQFVTTYVIGFATSSFNNDGGSLVNCQMLAASGGLAAACGGAPGQSPLLPDQPAVPPNPTYAPCCTLEQIAQYGGSSHAYFADTPQDLQSALGSILASIGINATARTVPTFSPALTAGNAQMYNAWLYPNPGAPWAGDIKRSSYACTAGPGQPAVFVPTTVADGDDFASNLDMSASVSARTFYAMEPKNAANTVHDATASIRPFAPTTASPYDGNLFETSTAFTGTGVSAVGSIATGLTDDALAITPGTSSYQYTPLSGVGTEFLTDAVTEKMILSFTFGQAKPGTLPTDFGWESRCPSCNDGNTAALEKPSSFGDIYHATPTVVAAPGALLDDITYSGFRTNITATTGGDAGATTPRRPVVYAATNDGLLHAFYADQTLPPQAPNEAWSMLMPAAMPQLLSSYPATDKMLLDGSPIVKDVVWDRTTINSLLCASGSMTCPWHTSLVAGYGPTQQGYYSVDVTSPTSPVFRWQLTKMPTGNYQIFGKHSATPAIATINYKDPTSMSGTVHEVGVAILPGGSDGLPTGGACERIHNQSGTGTDSEPAGYQARSYVNCWGTPATYASPVEGRSLSIVRLDTGEILRVFARKADFNSTDLLLNAGPSGSPGVVTDTQLDSPMTGTPVVYPADVGAVATKIFVGDADGTVWRFDVSNPDSTKWFGDTFLDLYNPTVDPPHAPTSANPPGNYPDGQPFDVPIVTSLDTTGSLVLNIASGTTQTFDTNGIEYLYSVSEKAGGSPFKLRASVNWYWVPKTPSQTTTPSFLQQGERISGPMAVFNSTLFFATYWAGSAATGCNPGQAKLWGFDYVTPFDTTDLSKGGLRSPTMTCSPTQDWTTPNTTSCGVVESAVVPGVAILATPACSTTSTTSFAGGGSHTALSNIAQGSFSLVANVAAQGSTPGSQTQKALPTPVSPTRIDAWAAVVE